MGYSLQEVIQSNMRHQPVSNARIWPISPDAMTMAVKRKMLAAGMDPTGFGSHSFRSGMLGSVILNYHEAKGAFQNAIDRACMVANWRFRTPIVERYLKDSTKASVICTNLTGMSQFQETPPSSSEDYHQTVQAVPIPKKRVIVTPVKNKFAELIARDDLHGKAWEVYLKRCFSKSVVRYAARVNPLLRENLYGEKLIAGKKMIDEAISYNLERVEPIALELYSIARNEGYLDDIPILPETPAPVADGPVAISRHHWTEQESELLIQEVQSGKTWDEILKTSFPTFRKVQLEYRLTYINERRKKAGLAPLRLKRPKTKRIPYSTELVPVDHPPVDLPQTSELESMIATYRRIANSRPSLLIYFSPDWDHLERPILGEEPTVTEPILGEKPTVTEPILGEEPTVTEPPTAPINTAASESAEGWSTQGPSLPPESKPPVQPQSEREVAATDFQENQYITAGTITDSELALCTTPPPLYDYEPDLMSTPIYSRKRKAMKREIPPYLDNESDKERSSEF